MKVKRNTAEAVGRELTAQLKSLEVKTLTRDNGRELAHHQRIAHQLSADFYFAHPYWSWERGLNEKTNGLVGQDFPKQRDFSKITDREISTVDEQLNKRPGTTPGDKTPDEIFFKLPLVPLTT